MNKELYKHWLDVIYPVLPERASVTSFDHSEKFEASMSWELDCDPRRPHKESRIIVIEIPKTTVDDYKNKSINRQKMDDKKLMTEVKEFLQDFNPDHDTPLGQSPPEKRLVISGAVLDS